MKNRFTTTNAALVLIDHQAGTINLARNIPRAEIVRNMPALARREQNNIVAQREEYRCVRPARCGVCSGG